MFANTSARDLFWRLLAIATLTVVALSCPMALGSGPRWVTGPPYFNNSGNVISWYTPNLQYYTDPGALSASVDHAAADALVARAAAVWNIPTASLVLTQGGTLNQHISSANIFAGSTGLTFPADAQAANYQSKPIAVIYDADGSVTDLLLGTGASDPTGCRQAGVTESVDSFSPNGQILHALLILNGRCSGPNPDQQTQLQYQLMRAFGRVLGLAWSQTNDNVFTGTPTPTPSQRANWPVMHPIDLLCGPYTFKCMQQPFALRPDDVASMAMLYPIGRGQAPAGKQDTLARAIMLDGTVNFNSGFGMEEVNVTVRRWHAGWAAAEDWQEVSGVTGFTFRQGGATFLRTPDGSVDSSIGSLDAGREPYFSMTGIPLGQDDPWETLLIATEPINPLYTGEYAVAPYNGNTIAPSGDPVLVQSDLAGPYGSARNFLTPANTASQCGTAYDGAATDPVATPSQGWWTGWLCGYGHTAWRSLAVRAGRTLTLEVTARDEQGNVSMNKAMPILGAWKASDDPASTPSLGAAPAAFNSLVAGMTGLALRNPPAGSIRFAIQDERGAGRPDFTYSARLLYADTVSPANVPATGGQVTISGMGFRTGMTVLIHGVAAIVTGATANQITATVPSMRSVGLTRAAVVDITVSDPSTGGSSTMTGALGYASSAERLQVNSVPSGNITVGVPAPTPFSVQVVASDGVTPVAGESVTFSAAGSAATLSGCGAATCTALTDAQGMASMTLTPSAVGALDLSVATPSVRLGPYRVTATTGPDALHLVSSPAGIQTTGWPATVSFSVQLTAGNGVTPRAGQTVSFSASGAAVLFGACGGPICSVLTNSAGVASTTVTLLSAGSAVLSATSGQQTISTTVASAPATIHLVSAPSGIATAGLTSPVSFKVQILTGDGVTPVSGEPVAFMASGAAVTFSACSTATCTVVTDAYGFASASVTPTAAGLITLSAAAREGAVTAALTAAPEILRATQLPSGSVPVGTAAANPFTVQLLQADGTTPVTTAPVAFALTTGSARWSACPTLPCTLLTDATGKVSGYITPLGDGAVTLVATAAGSTQLATITGTTAPNVLTILSAPAATLFQGDTASQPFAVRVLTGDLTTGVAAQPVTFTVDNGAVLTACGASTCTLTTDRTGLASVNVTGTAGGTVHLSATSATGAVTALMTVLPRTRSLTILRPTVYVAEGTAFTWTADLTATDSSASVIGVNLRWSASSALHFAAGSSTLSGVTSAMLAASSPLGAGVVAEGTACAWISTCATVRAVGVSGTEFQVIAVDGYAQSLPSAGSFAPVHLRITDASGHPVAAALVTVRQTVTAWEQACAGQGRCGLGAVLHASQQNLRSDIDGVIEVAPDTAPGVASLTAITASAGTQGAATVTLQRQP